MKKVYAAIFLLAIIVSAGVTERIIANRTAEDILAAVSRTEKACEHNDQGELYELCVDTKRRWEAHKPSLELFFPHADIDCADVSTEKLVIYAKDLDYIHLKATLAELKCAMTALKESENITIYNLM